ncbi:MAG: hypothetical protein CMK07_16600 [Ponticaulis sp.]|nr:hypothetical protein [Ponticaulis sp.]
MLTTSKRPSFVRKTRTSLLCVSLLLVSSCTGAASTDPSWEVELRARLQEFDRQDAPAVVVGIARQGETVFAEGFGMADLEQNIAATPDTIFHVASVSKQFTAFSIALLEMEEKVSREDDIREFLPYVPDYGTPVRIRHLIHHTSGLRSFGDLFMLGGQYMDGTWKQSQVVNLVAQQSALDFAPGSEYTYNNTGYSLLGEIVTAATGQTLREFTTENIFGPLDMTNTFVGDDETEIIPNRAKSYTSTSREDGSVTWKRHPLNFSTTGSTGLKSTASDLLKWGSNFSSLRDEKPELMEKVLPPSQLDDGTPINYGYALAEQYFASHRAIGHSGSEASFRARIAWFPEQDVSIVILSNFHIDNAALMHEIASIYLGETPSPEGNTIPPEVEQDPSLTTALEGSYLPEFGRLITLTSDQEQLIWSEQDGTVISEIIFHDDQSFETPGRRQYTYFTPEFDDQGEITGLIRHDEIDLNVRVPKVQPWQPDSDTLKGFEGRFYSGDVDQTYSFSVVDGVLLADSLWAPEPLVMTPSVEGRFDAEWPLNSVEFLRDAAGNVTSMTVHSGRVRNMIFEKQE